MLSRFRNIQLFATPWTVAHQVPLPMGFSRREDWSGLSCPPPGDLPDPGNKPVSLQLLHSKQILYSWVTGDMYTYICSCLSLLPPLHPLSRSPQSTELSSLCVQRLPTSCLFYTWWRMHVSAALSVSFPSRPGSTGPFATSASLFLPCNEVLLYHFSRFRIYALLFSCYILLNSSRPHGLWPARLPCPWYLPGKTTEVGCHFLLGILLTEGFNPCLLCCKQVLYHWTTESPYICINMLFIFIHLELILKNISSWYFFWLFRTHPEKKLKDFLQKMPLIL